jgi:predicted acylesterase/phospholipase RssA
MSTTPSPSIWWTLLGLDPSHLSLVSRQEFIQNKQSQGLLLAIIFALKNFMMKICILGWKLAAPDVVLRRLIALIILQLGHEAIWPFMKNMFQSLKSSPSTTTTTTTTNMANNNNNHTAQIITLRQRITNATCYEEWRDASRALEALTRPHDQDLFTETGRFKRMKDKTYLYKRLVKECNVKELMYRLRGELLRKHWGLGESDDDMTRENPHFRHHLAEYMETVCAALALIAKGTDKEDNDGDDNDDLTKKITSIRTRADFFSETLHSFGRSALLLSGGARLGLLHLGVVRCLRDQGLLPRVISGASAGSIVAVMLGAYRDEELNDKLFNPANINLRFFAMVGEDERGPDAVQKFSNNASQFVRSLLLMLPPPLPELAVSMAQVLPVWFNQGTLLDVNVLAKAIRSATGDLTFKEAFDRTGRIISITISPTGDRDFPMLLNYLTTPNILLWSASVASCAIPGIFAPVELLAKDHNGNITPYYPEGRTWSDGSVENDLPMERLAELFNVNHFVVSQVNPHARLLAPMSIRKGSRILAEDGYTGYLSWLGWLSTAMEASIRIIVDFCRDETRSAVKHWAAAMLVSHPIAPKLLAPIKAVGKSLIPILTQKYTGDITIMPELTMKGLLNLLTNPTPEEYLKDLDQGERNVWPHVSRMRLHCAIEILLDDCRQACRRQLSKLEEKLLKSPSLASSSLKGFSTSSSSSAAVIPTASVLNLSELDVAAPGLGMMSLLNNVASNTNNNNSRNHRLPSVTEEGSVSINNNNNNNNNNMGKIVNNRGRRDSLLNNNNNTSPNITNNNNNVVQSDMIGSPTRQRPGLRRDSSLSGPTMAFDKPVLARQGSLRPNTSFYNLNNKLLQRVQSFAVGLNSTVNEQGGNNNSESYNNNNNELEKL